MPVATPIRVAAVLLWVVFGFRAYRGGPIERFGSPTTISLLAAFMAECTLEGVAGWLLWSGHKSGAILALALLPVGAFFWWGFAWPIPPFFALIRTALI